MYYVAGGKSRGHKGRPKRYLTAEEIRAEEEKKKKESEWRVCASVLCSVKHNLVCDMSCIYIAGLLC